MAPPQPTAEQRKHAQIVLAGAESFACRLRCDLKHAEQVRLLALQLFDKLWPYHHLDFEREPFWKPRQRCMIPECSSTAKDTIVTANIWCGIQRFPGLRGWAKNMTACLIRYHNKKSEPSAAHKYLPHSIGTAEKRAHSFRDAAPGGTLGKRSSASHRQADHRRWPARCSDPRGIADNSRLNLGGIERKARLLERELNLHLSVSTGPGG
jgi:exopolyphosphatase/pppGpp-phosphohydrolase